MPFSCLKIPLVNPLVFITPLVCTLLKVPFPISLPKPLSQDFQGIPGVASQMVWFIVEQWAEDQTWEIKKARYYMARIGDKSV